MDILGISIAPVSRDEVRKSVRTCFESGLFRRIATVNPEFLLLAEKHRDFRDALLCADLRVVDGFGLVLAGWLRGVKFERFPGTDLLDEILAIANERKLSLFLAIRKDGLSAYEEVHSAISRKHPNIIVDGSNMDVHSVSGSTYKMQNTEYDLLLCNFGAPEQEIFLESLRSKPGDIRLAMGVGGSFDFLTGKVRRAPRWMRVLGLEWSWRLLQQPKRWQRIMNAVVFFPLALAKRAKKTDNTGYQANI